MAVHEVSDQAMTYTVADDDRAADDLRWWAILRTRVVDEITGKPPLQPITLRSETRRCQPRTGPDGLCGLVARPRDVSSALVTAGALTAEVCVPGYLPRPLTGAVDAARRRLAADATAGSVALGIDPPDPLPADPPARRQFRPGRGLMLARPATDADDELGQVADTSTPVVPAQVPLARPTWAAHPANTAVASVPIVLPDQPLHRASPVVVRGRALLRTTPATAAVPATSLGIRVVWWSLQEVADNLPGRPPDLVSLSAPLSFEHAVGTTMTSATPTPDGVARNLRAVARAGATEVVVSPGTGLAITGGDYLLLEAADSQERELVVTSSCTAPATAAAPATVRLNAPLAFAHAAGTSVMCNTLTSVPLTTVAREAQAGDRVLFGAGLATTAGAPTDFVVRLSPATAVEELRFARRPPVMAGGAFLHPVPIAPDGTFALPPLARLAQVEILAAYPGYPPPLPTILIALDDSSADNVQILFSP